MWLLDRFGSYAAFFGMLAGIFIAVICVWALGVILCALIASLVYWFRYRSIPVAVE
jgi:ABC-type lipoprotein release transport system permease subunit